MTSDEWSGRQIPGSLSRLPLESTMRRTPIRILLALGWYDHRLHRGIERYARQHGWSVAFDVTRQRTIPWGWDGDGILAWLGPDHELAEFVHSARLPTVDFSFRRPQLKFTRVLEDTNETARIVANHLLTRGVRNFVFFSDAENWVYDERGGHFQRELALLGHNVLWLRWHQSSDYCADESAWSQRRQWLMAALQRLERPAGIFAACDELAQEVLEACESAGMRVPEDVAIVGAGDSLLAVNAMATPISSVDTNLEMVGYRGAHELDRLIHKQPGPLRPIRIPPAGLVERKSSDILAVNHPGIVRGVRFLRENSHRPIRVEHLAQAACMSLRAFHKAFAETLGGGPGAEIQRARVERARCLLRQSREKLSVIASACGYRSSNSFSVAFKKLTGMSPSEYRSICVISDARLERSRVGQPDPKPGRAKAKGHLMLGHLRKQAATGSKC